MYSHGGEELTIHLTSNVGHLKKYWDPGEGNLTTEVNVTKICLEYVLGKHRNVKLAMGQINIHSFNVNHEHHWYKHNEIPLCNRYEAKLPWTNQNSISKGRRFMPTSSMLRSTSFQFCIHILRLISHIHSPTHLCSIQSHWSMKQPGFSPGKSAEKQQVTARTSRTAAFCESAAPAVDAISLIVPSLPLGIQGPSAVCPTDRRCDDCDARPDWPPPKTSPQSNKGVCMCVSELFH